MSFTKEQLEDFKDCLYINDFGKAENIEECLREYDKSKTTEQLKQLCAVRGFSIIEWYKFDISSIPSNRKLIVENASGIIYETSFNESGTPYKSVGSIATIVRWAYLPQPINEKSNNDK